MREQQACYVCLGAKQVFKNFYVLNGAVRVGEEEKEDCRTCEGNGQLYIDDNTPAPELEEEQE